MVRVFGFRELSDKSDISLSLNHGNMTESDLSSTHES